jgi:hypothetical protein
MRFPLGAVLLVMSALVHPGEPGQGGRADPQASPPVAFPAGVEQVIVDVLVFDEKGEPVEGLTREDFTVKEGAGRRPSAASRP